MGASRTARFRSPRAARELPRVEDLDDAETGKLGRVSPALELDESLYELTVLPMVHVRRTIPPLPRIGSEFDDDDTGIVAPTTLQRLRAEAKTGRREPMKPEALESIWGEVVGEDPEGEHETSSGIRTVD